MAAARKTNWVAIWISAAVVVAIAVIAVLVVQMNRQAVALAESPASAVVDEETGAITLGDGPNVLEEYLDFMCPYCHEYHETYGEDVAELVEEGEVTLNVHPIAILDSQSNGTQFSTRAAGAVYCVAEANPDAVYPFIDALFRDQPREGTEGLSDDQIAGLASEAGAGDAASCIADGEYMDYVTKMTPETPVAPGASGISTPTILLNDEFVSLTWDPQADIIDKLQ
ncbi:thioredoxin domain-containing protein [Microbacterium sp. Marseille-Q6965]|uniref:DsbA family protein n=1 Tax=Microbacterium sp. Marseille-Q6965 TaxID=2965072 RepID=UPI0021B71CB8|nr:thioredoxin domain-containing protein [Microbacterium sp. Marseille-Q6965]